MQDEFEIDDPIMSESLEEDDDEDLEKDEDEEADEDEDEEL